MCLVVEDDSFGDFIQVPSPVTSLPNPTEIVMNNPPVQSVNTNITGNKGKQ